MTDAKDCVRRLTIALLEKLDFLAELNLSSLVEARHATKTTAQILDLAKSLDKSVNWINQANRAAFVKPTARPKTDADHD